MATPQAAVTVRRNERDRLHSRPGDHLGDDVTRDAGEIAEAALLPRGDDQADTGVVRDGGARGSKRNPSARALAAARDGPRDRRAAALTDGRGDPRQCALARRTERDTRNGADDASLRKQEVEQHMEPR